MLTVIKRRKAWWMAAAVVLMVALATGASPRGRSTDEGIHMGEYAVLVGAPYAREQALLLTTDSLTPGELSLIDRDHALASQEGGTRDVLSMIGQYFPVADGVAIKPEVIYALCDMRAERKLDGMIVSRGTNSFAEQTDRQREAYHRYAQAHAPEDALALAAKYVPSAGQCEHQSGYAFDIELRGELEMGLSDRLSQSAFGVWLKDNLWHFGLIERYPDEKAAHFVGGCEGIHIRYVGREHALVMRALNLCLEEYLDLLHARGSVTVFKGDSPWALILCLPVDGGGSVLIPRNAAVTSLGGDNDGHVVITLKQAI